MGIEQGYCPLEMHYPNKVRMHLHWICLLCLDSVWTLQIVLKLFYCLNIVWKAFWLAVLCWCFSFLFSPPLSGEAGAGGTRWLALLFKCDTHPISILPRYQICYFEKDFFLHINLEPDEIRLRKDIFCSVVWKIMKRL